MAAKYRLIARELEQLLITSGKEKLPTEAELCERFHCSRQTVRSALSLLENDGIIYRRQGSGSFAAKSIGNREIALILAEREEYLSPALISDIRKAVEEAGYSLLCYETHGSRTKEREFLSELLIRRPAGILLEPITDLLGCYCEDLLNRLSDTGIPAVYLNGRYAGTDFPAVSMQNTDGAGILMAHLAANGHKQIAGILKSDVSRGAEQFRGCVEASAILGVQFAEENCLWFSEQERRILLGGDNSLIRHFFQNYLKGCTAVICFNDEIAYRLKRNLPEQRSAAAIVSFDNSYLALTRDAQLTTLTCSGDSVGKTAVRLLLQKSKESVSLPWKLVVRKSG